MSSLPTGTITFLFTDIEGSTLLLQQLGETYRHVLADHHRLLRAAFARGYEFGTQGDALFVVFKTAGGDADWYKSAVGALRARLPAEAIEIAWAQGRDMTPKDAVALALAEAGAAAGPS